MKFCLIFMFREFFIFVRRFMDSFAFSRASFAREDGVGRRSLYEVGVEGVRYF